MWGLDHRSRSRRSRSRSRRTVLLGAWAGAGAGMLPRSRSRSRSRPKMSRLRIPDCLGCKQMLTAWRHLLVGSAAAREIQNRVRHGVNHSYRWPMQRRRQSFKVGGGEYKIWVNRAVKNWKLIGFGSLFLEGTVPNSQFKKMSGLGGSMPGTERSQRAPQRHWRPTKVTPSTTSTTPFFRNRETKERPP